jgi:hypothetical protein
LQLVELAIAAVDTASGKLSLSITKEISQMNTFLSLNAQRGKVSGLLIGIGSAVLFIGIVIAVIVSSYWSAYNYGNRMDNQLIAIQDNNKNIYAQGTQRVMEIVQVPKMYADDLGQLIEKDIQGRYGKNGSQAMMQWITERQLTVDPSLYAKVQQTVEQFRLDFQNNQTRLIDVKRSYMTAQGSLWQGLWLRIAGFPKVNMADFSAITTDQTEAVFEAGKETGPLKLR